MCAIAILLPIPIVMKYHDGMTAVRLGGNCSTGKIGTNHTWPTGRDRLNICETGS